MNTESQSAVENAPRIIDPGGEGWAPEPKVSQAELLLHGELAGVVRLLGQAAVASADAYSLTCKHSHEMVFHAPSEEDTAYTEAVAATWQLHENALAVCREIASKSVALQRVYGARRENSMQKIAEAGSTL